jgi:hypothetical protein
MKYSLVVAILASAIASSDARAITVKIYSEYNSNSTTDGTPYSGYVDQFSTRDVDFHNWAPFGLTQFAAVVTGWIWASHDGYYISGAEGAGWYSVDMGMFGYFLHRDEEFQGPNETMLYAGYNYFTATYAHFFVPTDAYPTTTSRGEFVIYEPYPWGGDPRLFGPDGSTIAEAHFVTDYSPTILLAGGAWGILAASKHLRDKLAGAPMSSITKRKFQEGIE